MKEKVLQKFKSVFEKDAELVIFAPGRINLIGEHIDYNHGHVLPAAIDKGIFIAISKSHDVATTIHAMDLNETYRSNQTDNPTWSVYHRAIAKALNEREINSYHYNAVFSSNLPIGAGLSSSAALCAGFLFALNELKPWKLDKISLAKLAQRAEHIVGIKCGLLDQFAILFSKADHFLKFDCLSFSKEYILFDRSDLKLMIVNSKVSHDLVSSAYNERRTKCESGFRKIQQIFPQVQNFRNVTQNLIDQTEQLDEDEKNFIKYVIEEMARVHAMQEGLEFANREILGELLNAGHEGLKSLYKVTCRETDFLVKNLNLIKGIFGARQMGGGFGGSLISFVDKNLDPTALNALIEAYKGQFQLELEVIFPKITQGIHSI